MNSICSNKIATNLNSMLDKFVELHKGMKQRDENWYKSMATTIGGSEIASLLAISENEELRKYKSPYSTFMDVVNNKIAIKEGKQVWQNGGVACWWGTLFEEVITKIIEIELGNEIKGDSICIQMVKGHRNSPDGYIVAHFCEDTNNCTSNGGGNDTAQLYTTDMDPALIKFSRIIMLEFKCPISRKPSTEIPKHYIPQLWSGLAVSPIASMALFIDSIFRKCSVSMLGDNIEYDNIYHNKDQTIEVSNPICWGMIGLYSKNKPTHFVDMGNVSFSDFNFIMGKINDKLIKTEIGMPWFRICAQSQSQQQDTQPQQQDTQPQQRKKRGNLKSIEMEIEELKNLTPKGHYFLGVLPWKLFHSSYLPIQRRYGFLKEILPLINKVHEFVM
jgi:hypothetical protein